MADLTVENHGSLFLLRPTTKVGQEWIDEHIPEDAMKMGTAVAVEHRYIEDIVLGALSDGLAVA